ncbi:MAG: hypothetical protein ACK4ON_01845 [Bacteroidia bacterium]
MKKIFFALVFATSTLFISSCGENEVQTTELSAIPKGMVEYDLSQHGTNGLPCLINIPDEETGKGLPQVMEGPMGGTQIVVGKDFNIEIVVGDGDMNQKKSDIAADAVFKSTYMIDEPTAILYKSEIPDAGVVQYHIYVITKIGNVTYEIEDVRGEENYTEEGIKRMFEAAKSLRSKTQA